MNKTEKLYYTDPFMYECSAQVVECTADGDKFKVITDRSCFFPCGGGQPSDYGDISGARVCDVREKDGVLYHITDKALEVGLQVHMHVDIERRKDHCAQHTGEHMISGIAKSLYGAVNVGFHMAEDYSTLDFDIMLTDEQIRKLESETNKRLRENRRIYTEMVDADVLHSLELRKKTDGIENRADEFRIVYIDGVDSCTCCGSHCNYTGEVGVIKLTAWQKYKSGMRIWFLCGERALSDYQEKQTITDTLAKRFSTKQEEVLALAIKQGDELASTKHALKQKITELCELRADTLLQSAKVQNGVSVITIIDENADMFEHKTLAEKLVQKGKTLCLLMSHSENAVSYTVASSEGVSPSANELCPAVNAALGAKGGGRVGFAQGKAPKTSKSQLEQAAEQMHTYIMRVIK